MTVALGTPAPTWCSHQRPVRSLPAVPVEDDGAVAVSSRRNISAKRSALSLQSPVGFLHQPHGVLRGQRVALLLQGQRTVDDGGLNGERVVGRRAA